jgi:hypothetical protein
MRGTECRRINRENQMTDDLAIPNAQRRTTRLWIWFLVGFVVVFVGSLFVIQMTFMRPQGDAVESCKLWKYYAVELPKLFSTQALGPATGSGSAALTTLFQHVLISSVGGAFTLAVGARLRRITSRKT